MKDECLSTQHFSFHRSLMNETQLHTPPTVWAHYRRTLIPTQLFILTLALTTLFVAGLPWPTVLVLFLSMEAFSVAGAFWAATLSRRIIEKSERLPLENKRKG